MQSAAQAYATSYISSAAGGGNWFARGMVGGALSYATGGKFGHGFVSAAIRYEGNNIAVGAIIRGTVSAATGGKFANGAITGAFAVASRNRSAPKSAYVEKGGVEVEGSAGVRNRGPQKVRHKFVTQTGEGMGWTAPNDAVEAFYKANEALYQSAKKNKEILGWLIKGCDEKYYFTDAIKVRDEYEFAGSIIDADGNKLSSKISLRGPVKGVLHSHPGGNFGSQEAFSNKDWGIAEAGIDYYVRTPKGDMRYINATISAGQVADSFGKKDGVSLCGTTPCLNPYGTK